MVSGNSTIAGKCKYIWKKYLLLGLMTPITACCERISVLPYPPNDEVSPAVNLYINEMQITDSFLFVSCSWPQICWRSFRGGPSPLVLHCSSFRPFDRPATAKTPPSRKPVGLNTALQGGLCSRPVLYSTIYQTTALFCVFASIMQCFAANGGKLVSKQEPPTSVA